MMNQIINRLKYWGQLLLLPVYWLSFLVPRNKKLWVFGSTFGRRFADNPRYFYLYVSQHSAYQSEKLAQRVDAWKKEGHDWKENEDCLKIRAVWISHNKEIVSFLQNNGYEAYYYHSFKGIWMALRAGVYLFDNYSKDINFWQSGRALKVNMWHGIPLKKIQADNVFDKFRHPANLWEKWKNLPRNLSDEKPSHYVLTTSEFLEPIFASAFRTKNVLVSGYPRNDSMLSKNLIPLYTDLEQQLLTQIQKKKSEENLQMIYYMPTFRDSETKFFDVVDMDEMNAFLAENQLLLCIKLHPKSKLRKKFQEITSKNIIVIDADTDPYVFIADSSLLITDYSSIYFDFILSKKPVLFFHYDLEEYLQDSREMYFSYEEYTPGRKAKNFRELQKGILDTLANKDAYRSERECMVEKMFSGKRNEAGEDLVEKIKNIL